MKIITLVENTSSYSICWCAHNGIVNIQKKAEQLIGSTLNSIVSGFHLFNPISKKYEKEELIHEIGLKLKTRDTKYFTCHCTGEKAFHTLRNILGDQIQYLAVSSSIEL